MKHRIYLGWDPNETLAYDVARFSFFSKASEPKKVQIFPLELHNLGHILTRPVEKRDGKLWCPISEAPMATEFAISRFCVPFLAKEGWALFADCDVICQEDIAELFKLSDDRYAVMVVKHNYQPTESVKMVNQVQTSYSRKNWSSVMLFNCSHPSNKQLTLEVLNQWPGRDLHAFKWLKDDEIGELPPEWNHLVGVQTLPSGISAKILHYTLGGPWLKDWPGGPEDDLWLNYSKMLWKS